MAFYPDNTWIWRILLFGMCCCQVRLVVACRDWVITVFTCSNWEVLMEVRHVLVRFSQFDPDCKNRFENSTWLAHKFLKMLAASESFWGEVQ